MTSGAATSAHPGQLTAVGPAGALSPGKRRPRLEGRLVAGRLQLRLKEGEAAEQQERAAEGRERRRAVRVLGVQRATLGEQ